MKPHPLVGATALAVFALACCPRPANADETVAVSPMSMEKTTTEATGPSMTVVWTGVGIFGLSYLPMVAVGASSGLGADRSLLIPIAGPWIDLTQRPGCAPGTSCTEATTDKVLLVVDGVFQAIGAITTVSGFLRPSHTTTTVRSAQGPVVRISPTQIGKGGYGMAALGTF
jgi:hypothetical protein